VLAIPQHGFVFLSTPKTGSTAIENAFAGRSAIVVRQPPTLKHMTARGFERMIAPILDEHGFPRDSYQLVCVIREPVDWVASWWRYRSRPEVAGQPGYTGDMSFDEFVEGVVSREIRIGNLKRFVLNAEGDIVVSKMFRYDRLDNAVRWMAEQIGMEAPELRRTNISPERPLTISPSTRAQLEERYATHAALYEAAE
jgi:Sulfotransferase family